MCIRMTHVMLANGWDISNNFDLVIIVYAATRTVVIREPKTVVY